MFHIASIPAAEEATKPIYTGAMVNTDEMAERFPSELPNKKGHHMTVSFKPENVDVPVGENTKLKVTGRLTTDKVDVLIVDDGSSDVKSSNKHPHITLATANDESGKPIPPHIANEEIANNQDKIVPLEEEIDATYGYFDGKSDVTSTEDR